MGTDETIVLRIKELISYLGLSNGKFADKIGVQRSDMSKYLSGKQNVGEKLKMQIMFAFPNIRKQWLYFGLVEMLDSPNSTTITVNRGGNINASNSAVATEGSAINISGRHDEQTSKRRFMLKYLLKTLKPDSTRLMKNKVCREIITAHYK